MAPAALLLSACGDGADLVSTVALPSEQSSDFGDGAGAAVAAPDTVPPGVALELTSGQRGYLDALAADGIRPSSDLQALSIGSYVCQARAAGHDQTWVHDHIAPMVRSDVASAQVSAPRAAPVNADAVIAGYIRIAVERLC
jgi:hypothetical protein